MTDTSAIGPKDLGLIADTCMSIMVPSQAYGNLYGGIKTSLSIIH